MRQCFPWSRMQNVCQAKLLPPSAPCRVCSAPPWPRRVPGLKLSKLTCSSISRSGLLSRLHVQSRWVLAIAMVI